MIINGYTYILTLWNLGDVVGVYIAG